MLTLEEKEQEIKRQVIAHIGTEKTNIFFWAKSCGVRKQNNVLYESIERSETNDAGNAELLYWVCKPITKLPNCRLDKIQLYKTPQKTNKAVHRDGKWEGIVNNWH